MEEISYGSLQSYRTLLQDHCALHSYRQLEARFSRIGHQLTFMDVPVVNDYFRAKMRTYLGPIGAALLAVVEQQFRLIRSLPGGNSVLQSRSR